VINGQAGDEMLKQLYGLNNGRITVVGSEGYSRISLGQKQGGKPLPKSYGIGLAGSISDHKKPDKPSWKAKMFSTGTVVHYNDVILSTPWGTEPIVYK